MRRLDRYILNEILGPLGLGFLIYTLLLLVQFLFRSAEMIIRRGVPAEIVGKLLVATLPNIVVLTIPMALLFGILVAVGKLSSSSEITALRSSGVSLFYLFRPILALSLLLTALNTLLMVYALPRGNTALQRLQFDIIRESATQQVEPRVFYEDWEGLVLYVFDIRPGEDRWQGVFLANSLPGTDNEITVAESGYIRADNPGGGGLVLHLENAVTHKVDFNEPDEYHLSTHRSLDRVLVDRYAAARAQRQAFRSLRSYTLEELDEVANDPEAPPERAAIARVEIHKKFAIPAVCVVFGLLALPLGFGNQKGGRSTGFFISMLVILAYHVVLTNGEEAARHGNLAPWLAMWLPNFVFLVAGAFLLARRNRDRSLIGGGLERWLRDDLWALVHRYRLRLPRRRRGSPPGTEEKRHEEASRPRGSARLVLRLPRPRVRFPNLLDRYIVALFFRVLGLVTAAVLTITVVADLTERVDDVMKNQVALDVVLDYYKYSSLQIFFEMSPTIVLVTTLVCFGLLSRSNEVIAAKSLGVSLYRLSAPTLLGALIVAGGAAFLQARVLPVTNQLVAQLDDEIRGRTQTRSYRRADRNWLFGQGRYIYNYLRYDVDEQALQRLQALEFDERNRLVGRFFADELTFTGDTWRANNAWSRRFENGSSRDYRSFDEPVLVDYPEGPDYFQSEEKRPLAMTAAELRRYIGEIKASGKAVPELEVELVNKLGYPLINLVMGMVALPFSFRLGRKGALYGIGLGVVLGMVFLSVFALSRTLGETGALPPHLAVWAPSGLFALLATYLFLDVET